MAKESTQGYGSGFAQVLGMVDELLEEEQNLKTLVDAFEERLDEDPLLFFRFIVMPLLSPDVTFVTDQEATIVWRSLCDPESPFEMKERSPHGT